MKKRLLTLPVEVITLMGIVFPSTDVLTGVTTTEPKITVVGKNNK